MKRPRATLRVDPIACDGHGICAELFPERVSLDDWGFPLIDPAPIPPPLEAHARRAVSECPKCALRLVDVAEEPPTRARRAASRAR
jgi:ferredoxin